MYRDYLKSIIQMHSLLNLERGLEGFPQFEKKCCIKFTLPRQMGRKKIDPRISTMFLK